MKASEKYFWWSLLAFGVQMLGMWVISDPALKVITTFAGIGTFWYLTGRAHEGRKYEKTDKK